ncbi:MAG: 50S ribosomal protein L29 [Candidatus Methanomethylicota archaeon]|uniref:Large ribosomal subunit protein uL29 n=1 Tax=Thermoproteota archaeon TaxID=2056631 RepID=A0A497EXF2_9CREN|nr:MAG: 50S ribosomal protein L29 [Candidatus Verstraetearchaeota archaeon]
MRVSEIRKMKPEERMKKLAELRAELARVRALAASGTPLDNPMRIRELRRAIARILTIQREEELGIRRKSK